MAAAGRHPPVRSVRCAALCCALPRSLETGSGFDRRVRSLAESDPDERPNATCRSFSSTAGCRSVPTSAGGGRPARSRRCSRRFELCLAQSSAYAARYRDLGAPRIVDHRQPQARRAGAAGRPGPACASCKAAIGDRPTIAAASTHAGEETALIETHRRLRHTFPRLLTIIAPRHPDRGPGIVEIAKDAGLTAVAALARSVAGGGATTSMSSTRSVSSGWSIAWRRSCSSAVRWRATAARIRSNRSSSARPCCTVRMSGILPRSTKRSMPRAAPN